MISLGLDIDFAVFWVFGGMKMQFSDMINLWQDDWVGEVFIRLHFILFYFFGVCALGRE